MKSEKKTGSVKPMTQSQQRKVTYIRPDYQFALLMGNNLYNRVY